MGKLDKSVEELSALLDTFYNEVDGWVELAEIYYLCNQYDSHPPYPLSKLIKVSDTTMRYKHSHMHCFWHPKIHFMYSNSQKSLTRVATFLLRSEHSLWWST
jgi:hypothetical protein